ncbi:hypothetical protein [Paracoccus sp. R86501]|uniref:hypothetical protein n=1 Tax=Paracoccus sp. R86501 TaxID=3101711 RepID=UPI00366B20A7
MRHLLAVLTLIAGPALADDNTTSGMIARDGITATARALAGQPASADRDMALSAVTFLGAVQTAFQTRWQVGATEPLVPLPILGAALPANPDPQPMTADIVTTLMTDLSEAMQATRDHLPDDDAALVLDLDDLWLDVDGDDTRGSSESLAQMAGLPLPEGPRIIRFDRADVEWLRAYTHLIQSVATLTLAFDPAPALADHIALQQELTRQFAQPPGQMARAPSMQMQAQAIGPFIDRIAVVLQTLRHQPDPNLTQQARDHMRQMIAANRAFWTLVAQEGDDDREWIPNDGQHAALGFDLPQGTGPQWMALLEEVDQALQGKMLVPFWRFAPGFGVDIAQWLQDPQPVDVTAWVQGTAALPYARPGLTVGGDSWDGFVQMFGGRAGLYMLLLN